MTLSVTHVQGAGLKVHHAVVADDAVGKPICGAQRWGGQHTAETDQPITCERCRSRDDQDTCDLCPKLVPV